MKINWFYVKMFVLLLLTVFLTVFATRRNEARAIGEVAIAFNDESTPFVTRQAVNKLLIVSSDNGSSTAKENLALSKMEARVNAHPIIKNADVYVTMSGDIGVNIEQRKPIARLNGKPAQYLDESGEVMPLSQNFSAHVPLVTGTDKADIPEVYKLASFIRNDDFLAKHIVGLKKGNTGEYILEPRKVDYKIVLGDVKNLEKRWSNYKAFYQKAVRDKTLSNYATISLQYEGQVVCERR